MEVKKVLVSAFLLTTCLMSGQNDKTDDGIVHIVMPLFGVQVVVKDVIKFLLEFEQF